MRSLRANTRCCVILLGCIFASAVGAVAEGKVECSAAPSKLMPASVRYCAFLPDGYASSGKRYPVLYYLHGLGDNEQSLVTLGGWFELENLRRQREVGDFIVITPDGGRSFYINSRDGKVPYGDFFIHEFVPFIEGHYRILATRETRGLTGFSMGGYGALRLAFANPQLFGSVTAHSAALVEEFRDIESAADAGMPQARAITRIFGSPIDQDFWNQNSPFQLAHLNAAVLRRMAIEFDCGSEDQYGFFRGAESLDRELTRLEVKHEAHIYPGDHSVDYFLSHLAESMKFHSGVFDRAKNSLNAVAKR